MLKKYFKMGSVVAIATCLAAVTMLSGCGKDDDKDKGKEGEEWNGGNLVLPDGYAWVQSTEGTANKDAFIFNDNRSVEYYEYEEGAWSSDQFEGADMTYETEGGKFTLYTATNEVSGVQYYTVSGNNLTMAYEAYLHVSDAWQHYTKQEFTPNNGNDDGDDDGDDESYSASDVVGAFQWTGTSMMKQAEWTFVFEENGTGYYVQIPDISTGEREEEYEFDWQYMDGGIIKISPSGTAIYMHLISKNTITEYYPNNPDYENGINYIRTNTYPERQ
ncbi:MAG: hypothetical protein LBU91_07035 [Bacteroidales bacterium]|jgi:hypothetical protein|nr:hypothetical protein [Bacteroidales bacterium]